MIKEWLVLKKSVVSKGDESTGRETLCSLEDEKEEGEVMGKRLQKRRFRMNAACGTHTGGSLLDLQSILACRKP
jgi:hypothetical protein